MQVCASSLRVGVIVALGFAAVVSAQEGRVSFERLSIEHGLSESIVEGILQDGMGFMWFATEGGLDRFDGYEFTAYRHHASDPDSLSYNEVKALYQDRSGVLWVGVMEGGLNRFDPVTGRFTHFHHDPHDPRSLAGSTPLSIGEDVRGRLWVGTQTGGLNLLDRDTGSFTHFRHIPGQTDSLCHDDVRAILEDGENGLWVGTYGGGLDRLDLRTGAFTHYRHDPGDPGSLANDMVTGLYRDRRGDLWVGTYGGGLNRLDRETARFVHHRHDARDPNSLAGDLVLAICEDHTGGLWVATDGTGLDRLDRVSGRFTHFRNDATDETSLSADRVWSLYEDRSHVLWVGTYGGGLSKIEIGRERFRHYRHDPGDPESLSHNIVWSFAEDRDGYLWVGTDSGGLNRLDPRTGRGRHFLHDPSNSNSLSHNTVRVVFADRAGMLWLGTHGGGLDRLDPRTLAFTHYRHDPGNPDSLAWNELRSVMQDRSGALWIGTYGGGLDRLDPRSGRITHHRHDASDPTSLSSDIVRQVAEDADGTLWVGTQGGGLDRLDPRTGVSLHYRADAEDPTSLSSDYVFAVLLAHDDTLWVGTYGGGLNRLDRESGKFMVYTTEEGLVDDSIYAILEDDDGNLWISTLNGLSRFDPRTGEFQNYSVRDGLQSNEFNGGSAYKSAKGELFFGGINGFNAFLPEEIRGNLQVPPVVVTDLQLSNRSVRVGRGADGRQLLTRDIAYTDAVTLSHRDDLVSFEFAALHYVAPERNRYSYRLEGLQESWVSADASQRFVTFTDLPTGRYVLRVRGSNSDGVWNQEGATLQITVTPPFWATWWFRLTALAALAGLMLAAHRGRTRVVRLTTELRAAHDAQMAIMPASSPVLEGYEIAGDCRPANEVGGDFYDWFWLNDRNAVLCISVCDIAGKAMPAAMTAVMSDGMMVSYATRASSPEEIVTGLNRSIYRKFGKRSFAAVCLVALDTTNGELRVVNAGICEPLHKRGGTVHSLSSPGPRFPLGIYPDLSYESGHARMLVGDVVVLYSDGVPEALDPAGEPYSYEPLEKLLSRLDTDRLSARGILDAVLDDVGRYTRGAPQHDDITVVVIKAVSPPPGQERPLSMEGSE